MGLSAEQKERYARHTALAEIGEEGQEKLLRGSVLLIGAGGLASPAAIYLAAAGVGTIGIADADRVDLSNLQRQIIHGTKDLGREKTESARESIHDINPEVRVETYPVYVSEKNIMGLIEGYDFVIDATDNFPSKFLINDACVLSGKPFSHGGIFRFGGQLMTYVPGSPCYRCVFKSPPPKEAVVTCREAGIIGAMCGVIGSLQAMEAVKYLTGVGELLTGRLLTYDALNMEFRTVRFHRDSTCPSCGENPGITGL